MFARKLITKNILTSTQEYKKSFYTEAILAVLSVRGAKLSMHLAAVKAKKIDERQKKMNSDNIRESIDALEEEFNNAPDKFRFENFEDFPNQMNQRLYKEKAFILTAGLVSAGLFSCFSLYSAREAIKDVVKTENTNNTQLSK